MGLFFFTYKLKYFIAKVLGLRNIGKHNFDIISHTDNFNRRYGRCLKSLNIVKSNTPTALLFSLMPNSYGMHIDSILGRALEKLGFKIVILTSYYAKTLSDNIHRKIYGFDNIIYIQDFMEFFPSEGARKVVASTKKAKAIEDIKSLKYKNTNVGLHSLASYEGKFPLRDVHKDKRFIAQLLKTIKHSCCYVDAIEKLIKLINPSKVISVEKGNTGNCEIFYESIYRGIDYLQWLSCHEPNSIMIKRYNSENYRVHPFSVSDETWFKITKEDADYTDAVLKSFESGYVNGNWFRYKNLTANKTIVNKDEIIKRFDLNPDKKIAIIFSHILDDANFFYGEDLFKSGFPEWLTETVRVAGKNREVNWLLKLHPANVYRRTNSGEKGEYGEIVAMKEALGEIPENVKIILPDIDINPYSFFMITDYGITVRGTVGAELPCFGIPVLTAGTGRYSGKGFTIDSNTPDEYLHKVANIQKIAPLSAQQRDMAIKHAYLFFKERPAKYDTFIQDIYPYPTGHPLNRDIEIVDRDIFNNPQLHNIARFIAFSEDDDYLASKGY